MFLILLNMIGALFFWLGAMTEFSVQSQEVLDYFEAGDYSRAAQLLELEVSSGSTSSSSHLFLGVCYLNLGQPSKALPHLQDGRPGTWACFSASS